MRQGKRKEEKKGKEKRDNKLFLYAQEALNIMKDMQKYISDIYRKKNALHLLDGARYFLMNIAM